MEGCDRSQPGQGRGGREGGLRGHHHHDASGAASRPRRGPLLLVIVGRRLQRLQRLLLLLLLLHWLAQERLGPCPGHLQDGPGGAAQSRPPQLGRPGQAHPQGRPSGSGDVLLGHLHHGHGHGSAPSLNLNLLLPSSPVAGDAGEGPPGPPGPAHHPAPQLRRGRLPERGADPAIHHVRQGGLGLRRRDGRHGWAGRRGGGPSVPSEGRGGEGRDRKICDMCDAPAGYTQQGRKRGGKTETLQNRARRAQDPSQRSTKLVLY